jgi:putative ABC transport system permease protein
MACRNLFRNRRRSLVTLLAIAVGFSAVSLFRGYTDNTYEGLRDSAIRGEGLGHLTIFKKGWMENGRMNPELYLLTPGELTSVLSLAAAEPHVVLATPELHISGLVTNGTQSGIFLARGVVPEAEAEIQGTWAENRPVTGQRLSGHRPWGVEMAADLARNLEFQPGSEGVILSNTLEGQMNALNVQVTGVYNTGNSATNDKFLRMPFARAQELYDTDRADRVVVLLDDWRRTDAMQEKLATLLAGSGLDVDIRTWEELSSFYSQVRAMFGMIFAFIFGIVLVIVVMSVVNTMGMAVLERTREIGTLRALGLKRRGVSFLFALEGGLIGLMGSAAGLGITLLVWAAVHALSPSYIPPGSSAPVPLVVNLVPVAMVRLSFFLILLSLGAAILPAHKAARLTVVDALGHV